MPMTKAEAAKRWQNGERILCAEYRGGKVESIRMRAEGGATRISHLLRHSLEIGPDALSMSEWLPDGTDPATVKIPFQKGDMVLLHLDWLTVEKGNMAARGQLELLAKG